MKSRRHFTASKAFVFVLSTVSSWHKPCLGPYHTCLLTGDEFGRGIFSNTFLDMNERNGTVLRNALIALYILLVLAISAVSRAEVAVNSVKYDSNSFMVRVDGVFAGKCFPQFQPHVARITTSSLNPSVIVNVAKTPEVCISNQEHQGRFSYVFDVRSLGLAAGETYRLQLGTEIQPVDFGGLFVDIPANSVPVSYATKNFVGQIVEMADGSFGFLTNDNVAYAVQSPLNLAQYVGSKVLVSGFELKHQVGPALDPQTVDPLPSFTVAGHNSMIMLVLGIGEITL